MSDSIIKKDTSVFNKDNYFDITTLFLTASFLAIYFIVYIFLGIFYENSDPSHRNTTDIFIFLIIIAYGLLDYYSLSSSEQDTYWTDLINSSKKYFNNAYSILEVGLFILFLYIGVYFLGIPMTPDGKPPAISFVESLSYILFFVLVTIQFFKYALKIDIIGVIFGDISLNNDDSKDDKKTDSKDDKKTTGGKSKEEAYNISNNLYTYEDAKSVCKALGSRLATYDEIEDAYNNGAEWGTYGWSEGQHAYFPTQKETWKKLQDISGHQHDLGRPGVNGGYFSNPNVRFGVNCYGVKPPMTDAEKALMSAKKEYIYPKNPADIALEAKVNFWKKNRDKLLVLNGHNTNSWSRY